MERALKRDSILRVINNYIYDAMMPVNINMWYQIGVALGVSLIIQIVTGVLLGFYYLPNISLAFDSVEYIMRDISRGWVLRYTHANGASIFFILVYLHIYRGIKNSSYKRNGVVWVIGIVILIVMIVTAFMGYCLVWGVQSLWGKRIA